MASLANATFTVRALTPIWTGDAGQHCSQRMLETAIIGSLRWWLEACGRSVGMDVPDPGDVKPYDPKKRLGLDPVSRIFGATGWRRRFRLSIESDIRNRQEIPKSIRIKADSHRDPRGGKTPIEYSEWRFGKAEGGKAFAWHQEFRIQILQTAPWIPKYDGTSIDLIKDLLLFISRAGTLGPKPQLGLGVIDFEHRDSGVLLSWLKTNSGQKASGELPSISDMIFGSVRCDAKEVDERRESFWGRTTFKAKAELRTAFRDAPGSNEDFRHQLLGTTKPKPVRSKVAISLPFESPNGWNLRYWAWLPPSLRKSYPFVGTPPNRLEQVITSHFSESAVADTLPHSKPLELIQHYLSPSFLSEVDR